MKDLALAELRPGAHWIVREDEIVWLDKNVSRPTDEEIDTKITEIKNARPMIVLRRERDIKLKAVDWWTSRALDGIVLTQEQKDYRTALRDLPSTASPKLDDNGKLTNVTWPTKPE
jgi:hypothetical protein